MSKGSYCIALLFGQFGCIMSCLEGNLSNMLDFLQLLPSLGERFFSVETNVKGYLSLTQVIGHLFLFVFDYWLSDQQRFYNLLPYRMLSFTGLPWDAKVLDIIEQGTWAFPSGVRSYRLFRNLCTFIQGLPYQTSISRRFTHQESLLST